MNGSQHTKTFRLGKKNNKQQLMRSQNKLIFWFRTNIVLQLFSVPIFDSKGSPILISKACYKRNTIFLSFQFKDCLYIAIVGFKFLSLLSHWKQINLRELHSSSGNLILRYVFSRKRKSYYKPRNFLISKFKCYNQQNNFKETVYWVAYYDPSQADLKIRLKLYQIVVLR